MKEHPILFSGPMVRAILDGRKTQTRRVINPQPKVVHYFYPDGTLETERLFRNGGRIRCPYGVLGDRLWVREACYLTAGGDDGEPMCVPPVFYAADGPVNRERYPFARPSIHMPRWASRITLEVLEVRVQKLQDITEQDAIAEGIEDVGGKPISCCPWRNYLIGRPGEMNLHCSAPSRSFQTLWDSINADRAPWGSNPWVWAVTFRRIAA